MEAIYKNRGITVSSEWGDFVTFLRDMGPKPDPFSQLDRRDNDAGYSKENCRWVSQRENLNNKRSSHFIEHDGRRMTVADWALEIGLNYRTLNNRINRGWSVERAFTEAVQEK